MNQTSRQRYLLGSEVAELLHVSPKTVARWAKEGKLPCMRTLGGHRRYPEREIQELRDKHFTSPDYDPRSSAGRASSAALASGSSGRVLIASPRCRSA